MWFSERYDLGSPRVMQMQCILPWRTMCSADAMRQLCRMALSIPPMWTMDMITLAVFVVKLVNSSSATSQDVLSPFICNALGCMTYPRANGFAIFALQILSTLMMATTSIVSNAARKAAL